MLELELTNGQILQKICQLYLQASDNCAGKKLVDVDTVITPAPKQSDASSQVSSVIMDCLKCASQEAIDKNRK